MRPGVCSSVATELRGKGLASDYDLSWVGRDYEGLRSLKADGMKMNEFLEQLNLWKERFPDLHDYDAIEKAVLEAKPERKVGMIPRQSDGIRKRPRLTGKCWLTTPASSALIPIT